MKVLAITHAHLQPDGLSPVSCERADSIVGAWGGKLGWEVHVVHTANTRWRGIWPDGKGLAVNIITEKAPEPLMFGTPQLFSSEVRESLGKGSFSNIFSLAAKRFSRKLRAVFSEQGFALPHQLAVAEKWGIYLSSSASITANKYNFVFACVGYGDEYLLQTALVLSLRLRIPMVVDLRDLWSEHHDPGRISEKQRIRIRRLEKKLLANTALVSAPQKHMVHLLSQWVHCPVYYLSHSAYIDQSWPDGHPVNDALVLLYAGKLYPNGAGLKMVLQLVKQLAGMRLSRPVKIRFFVEDPATLRHMAAGMGIGEHTEINGWVSPGELWQYMRSAHILLVPDPGVAENYPFVPTKTFQYAMTGRQLLCLQPNPNTDMEAFLDDYKAGKIFSDVGRAAEWVGKLSEDESIYNTMPPLRAVPQREQLAVAFGSEITKIIASR